MQILVTNNTITTTEFTPTIVTRHTYYYWDKDIEVRGNRLVFPSIDKQHSYCDEIAKTPMTNAGMVSMVGYPLPHLDAITVMSATMHFYASMVKLKVTAMTVSPFVYLKAK